MKTINDILQEQAITTLREQMLLMTPNERLDLRDELQKGYCPLCGESIRLIHFCSDKDE